MSDTPRVFLFLGPEEGLKNEDIDALRKRVAKQTGEAPDEHRFYLPHATIQSTVDILRNGSLFAAHRLVILHGVDQLRQKSDLEPLIRYLESPNPAATLVLVTDAVKVDSRLERAVPGPNRKVYWELFENQKQNWVVSYFRKHHVAISDDAVDLFLEVVENNTQELRHEAEKLCTYVGPDGTVEEADIEAFIYHSRDESVFTLFKHICDNECELALMSLEKLVSSGDASPVQIVGGLAFQVRRLLALRVLLDNDVPINTAFERLNIRGKRIQGEYRAGARRFATADLERNVYLLTEYDALFRSQRPGIHRCLLDLLLYQLMFRGEGLVRPMGMFADDRPVGEEYDADAITV